MTDVWWTVQLYVAWNIHEPSPYVYNWFGFADLKRYLRIIQKLGMNVLLRPGPYICAEWDFGGFPWWLASPDVSPHLSHPTCDTAEPHSTLKQNSIKQAKLLAS